MPSGSCLCGNLKISYSGEPMLNCLCHCTDCQKISGSAFSTNHVVPGDSFSSTGTPKKFTKKADSGNEINSFFCGDCGSTLWRESSGMQGAKIVKIGTVDGALNAAKPNVELYAPERVSWQQKLEGSEDKAAMP